MSEERIVTPEQEAGGDAAEVGLRPLSLDDFIGQEQACGNLRVFIEAAKSRGDALDHFHFYRPPG